MLLNAWLELLLVGFKLDFVPGLTIVMGNFLNCLKLLNIYLNLKVYTCKEIIGLSFRVWVQNVLLATS